MENEKPTKPIKQIYKRLIVAVSFLVLISVVIYINSDARIIRYVQKNHIDLEQFAEELILNNEGYGVSYKTNYNGWDVHYRPNNMVEFDVKAGGFASQTFYKGFYYSPNDVPLAYMGGNVEFKQEGPGWKWDEVEGDNWEYTQKIVDKWYWFEFHF